MIYQIILIGYKISTSASIIRCLCVISDGTSHSNERRRVEAEVIKKLKGPGTKTKNLNRIETLRL